MVIIRNVFRLKFGKAREAVALFREGMAIQKRLSPDMPARLLTDVTGPFYTVVLEISAPSLSSMDTEAPRLMGNAEWQANYRKLTELIESGSREVYSVVE